MILNRVNLNRVNLNRVCINTVGTCSVAKGRKPPEEDITGALLMEDGSLFLMEDGTYFALEKVENKAKESPMPRINKSYWNF